MSTAYLAPFLVTWFVLACLVAVALGRVIAYRDRQRPRGRAQ